jgi:hypothetical protein
MAASLYSRVDRKTIGYVSRLCANSECSPFDAFKGMSDYVGDCSEKMKKLENAASMSKLPSEIMQGRMSYELETILLFRVENPSNTELEESKMNEIVAFSSTMLGLPLADYAPMPFSELCEAYWMPKNIAVPLCRRLGFNPCGVGHTIDILIGFGCPIHKACFLAPFFQERVRTKPSERRAFPPETFEAIHAELSRYESIAEMFRGCALYEIQALENAFLPGRFVIPRPHRCANIESFYSNLCTTYADLESAYAMYDEYIDSVTATWRKVFSAPFSLELDPAVARWVKGFPPK